MPRRFRFRYEKEPLRTLFRSVLGNVITKDKDYPDQVYEVKAFTQELAAKLAEDAPSIPRADVLARYMDKCRGAAPYTYFRQTKTKKNVRLIHTCQLDLCPQCHYRRVRDLFTSLWNIEASGWALTRGFVDLSPLAHRSRPNADPGDDFTERFRSAVEETKALIQEVRATAVRRVQRVYGVDRGVVLALVRPTPQQNLTQGQQPGHTWELQVSCLIPYRGQPPYEMEILDKDLRKIMRSSTALPLNHLERVDAHAEPKQALINQLARAYFYARTLSDKPTAGRYWRWFLEVNKDRRAFRPFGNLLESQEYQSKETKSARAVRKAKRAKTPATPGDSGYRVRKS